MVITVREANCNLESAYSSGGGAERLESRAIEGDSPVRGAAA